MKCKNCKREIQDHLKFCKYCGAPVDFSQKDRDLREEGSFISCSFCGEKVPSHNKYCTTCGEILKGEETGSSGKKTTNEGRPRWRKFAIIFVVITMALVLVTMVLVAIKVLQFKDSPQENPMVTEEKDKDNSSKNQVSKDPVMTEEKDNSHHSENQVSEEKDTKDSEEEKTDEGIEDSKLSSSSTEEEMEPSEDMTIPAFQRSDVAEIYGSSFLQEKNRSHTPERIFDGNLSTAWVEGVAGQGIDQWITMDFIGERKVEGLIIHNGYHKSEKLYYENSRPKEIVLQFSNGEEETFTLMDEGREVQKLKFSKTQVTDFITLTIKSVYPGSKYEDTVISEIDCY